MGKATKTIEQENAVAAHDRIVGTAQQLAKDAATLMQRVRALEDANEELTSQLATVNSNLAAATEKLRKVQATLT